MVSPIDLVFRALIEVLSITLLINRFLIPIQKNRKGGMIYFILAYVVHNFFWAYSVGIKSIPLRCIEYYVYYVIIWLIIDYFFEGEGFVNFISVFATVFAFKFGVFGFIYLFTGVYGQFDSAEMNELMKMHTYQAYVVYAISLVIGYFTARIMIAIYRHINRRVGFVMIAVLAAVQMLPEIVNSAESVYIVLPDIVLFMVLGIFMQNRILNRQEKMETHYHQLEEVQKQRQEKLNKIRHDLANHISVIDNARYAEKEKETLHKIEGKIQTGSAIIDCLLDEKRRICRTENITITETFTNISDSCVSNFDWISLFSNLIDNAIEACKKVDTDRRISYTMERRGVYFLFRISNSKTKTYRPIQENFITTKSDISQHGYGTQIIRDITRKYDGRVRYEDTQNEMNAFIILNAWKT